MGLLRFVAAATFFLGTSQGAGDFTISLQVQAGQRQQISLSGQPAKGITVKVKEVVWVRWSAVNGAGATLPDVTLHVFMDRGSARADAPKPGPGTLYESAVILDFEPGGKSGGEFRMPMPAPGTYFVRAETIGAGRKLGKEVAAATEVSVQ